MITPIILFLVGLVLLIKGGDWFVDGATGVSYTHLDVYKRQRKYRPLPVHNRKRSALFPLLSLNSAGCPRSPPASIRAQHKCCLLYTSLLEHLNLALYLDLFFLRHLV